MPPTVAGPGFAASFGQVLKTFVALYKSDPGTATDTILDSKQTTGNAHFLWVVAGGIVSLLAGLSALFFVLRLPEWGRPNPALLMFLAILASFLYLVGRGGAVAATVAMRGRRASFGQALSIAALGFVAIAPVYPLLWLCIAANSAVLWTVFVIVWVFLAFFSETAIYIALARFGRFEKSPLLQHAIMATVWLVVVTFLVSLLVGETLANHVSGLFGGLF